MILVNDKQVEFTKFPDGTTSFRFSPHLPPRMFAQPMESPIFSITWKYDNDEECILLWYLTNHIRENNQRPIIRLSLPYIPNARMDRVKNADEVFTLRRCEGRKNKISFCCSLIRIAQQHIFVIQLVQDSLNI